MVSPVLLGATLVLAAVWTLRTISSFLKSRGENFPPGPIRLPYVGSYFHLLFKNFNAVHHGMEAWNKKYKSKLVGWFMGPYPVLSTGDLETVKEVFKHDAFEGRPFPYAVQIRSWMKPLGIFFTNGDYWLEQRRFSLRYMRDFGLGRRMAKLEELMENELKLLFDYINTGPESAEDEEYVKEDGIVKAPNIFNVPFINAFTAVLIGRVLPPEKRHLVNSVNKGAKQVQRSLDATGRLLSIFPWLGFIAPRVSNYSNILEGHEIVMEYIKALVEERKQHLEDDSEGFFDVYLKELEARKALGEEPTTFSEEQLLIAAADLLIPTSTLLGTQLAYLIMRLLHQPEIAEKMYNEIISVVRTERLPNLDDRPFLPYCEATLRESMRMDTTLALGVPRLSLIDTELNGFKIPQFTTVITNLEQMHMDKDTWGDPENFRPERFLDEDGNLCLKNDKSLPFGLGRRVCVGETFSRNTLFVYLVGLIQKYKIELPPGGKLPDIAGSKSYALMTICKEFWIKFVPR